MDETHSYRLSPLGPALQLVGGSREISASSFWMRFAAELIELPFDIAWRGAVLRCFCGSRCVVRVHEVQRRSVFLSFFFAFLNFLSFASYPPETVLYGCR
jgi:hypothetical protein